MTSKRKKFGKRNYGFTLAEAITATAILAFVTTSIWVVIDRCVTSTTNSKLKMEAFEVARENMENILVLPSVKETSESGISDRYPGIEWETTTETFYEPISSQMWLRAISIGYYRDTHGEVQSVELEHWLTGINKNQLLQILMSDDAAAEDLSLQLIETIEDAAEYAGVSTETIEQWLNNGMKTTENDFFIKNNLDLFKNNDGNPSKEDKISLQLTSSDDLVNLKAQQSKSDRKDEIDPKTGLTYGQMEQMDIQDIWELLKQAREGSLSNK